MRLVAGARGHHLPPPSSGAEPGSTTAGASRRTRGQRYGGWAEASGGHGPHSAIGERGSAMVMGIGVVTGLVTVLVLALGLVAVLVAGQQARTAADLGALAAAGQLVQGVDDTAACALAARVTERHGVVVRDCAVERHGVSPLPEVTLDVERAVAGTRWVVGVTARAGASTARPG